MLNPDEAKYLTGNEQVPTEINVTVTVCFSKTITISVDDYKTIDEGVDEDGAYYREDDYSACDLYTPAIEKTNDEIKYFQEKGWDLDEFETTLSE